MVSFIYFCSFMLEIETNEKNFFSLKKNFKKTRNIMLFWFFFLFFSSLRISERYSISLLDFSLNVDNYHLNHLMDRCYCFFILFFLLYHLFIRSFEMWMRLYVWVSIGTFIKSHSIFSVFFLYFVQFAVVFYKYKHFVFDLFSSFHRI